MLCGAAGGGSLACARACARPPPCCGGGINYGAAVEVAGGVCSKIFTPPARLQLPRIVGGRAVYYALILALFRFISAPYSGLNAPVMRL